MIFNSIVDAISNFFTWILQYFPETDPVYIGYISDGLYNFKELIAGFNWIFPVEEFMGMITGVIMIGAAAGVVRLARWIGSIFTGGIVK